MQKHFITCPQPKSFYELEECRRLERQFQPYVKNIIKIENNVFKLNQIINSPSPTNSEQTRANAGQSPPPAQKTSNSFFIENLLGLREENKPAEPSVNFHSAPRIDVSVGGYGAGLAVAPGRIDMQPGYGVAMNANLPMLAVAPRESSAYDRATDLSVAGPSGSSIGGRDYRAGTSTSAMQNSTTSRLQQKSMNNKRTVKTKRVRTIFTPEQLEQLESTFALNQYMVGPERLYLAQSLQLTEAQVKVWFQNRRIKWRKHNIEVVQLRLAALKRRDRENYDETSSDSNKSDSSRRVSGFYKTVEKGPGLEIGNLMQFQTDIEMDSQYDKPESNDSNSPGDAAM